MSIFGYKTKREKELEARLSGMEKNIAALSDRLYEQRFDSKFTVYKKDNNGHQTIGWSSCPSKEITAVEAVKMLADHVGCSFEYEEGKKAEVKLKKK